MSFCFLQNHIRAASFSSLIRAIGLDYQWDEFLVKQELDFILSWTSVLFFHSTFYTHFNCWYFSFELTYVYLKFISRSAHDSGLDRVCYHGYFSGAVHEASLGISVWEKGVVPSKCLGWISLFLLLMHWPKRNSFRANIFNIFVPRFTEPWPSVVYFSRSRALCLCLFTSKDGLM